MDFASFIGVISGVVLIVSAIIIGGDVHNFINIQGMMIVVGGTVAATLLTFQYKDVVASFKAAYFVFTRDKSNPNDMFATMIKLCHVSRRQGILELAKVKTKLRLIDIGALGFSFKNKGFHIDDEYDVDFDLQGYIRKIYARVYIVAIDEQDICHCAFQEMN